MDVRYVHEKSYALRATSVSGGHNNQNPRWTLKYYASPHVNTPRVVLITMAGEAWRSKRPYASNLKMLRPSGSTAVSPGVNRAGACRPRLLKAACSRTSDKQIDILQIDQIGHGLVPGLPLREAVRGLHGIDPPTQENMCYCRFMWTTQGPCRKHELQYAVQDEECVRLDRSRS